MMHKQKKQQKAQPQTSNMVETKVESISALPSPPERQSDELSTDVEGVAFEPTSHTPASPKNSAEVIIETEGGNVTRDCMAKTANETVKITSLIVSADDLLENHTSSWFGCKRSIVVPLQVLSRDEKIKR